MSNYDVIVVGGGTAGSVIAARLTQRGDVRVLLIEAGSADPLPGMSDPPSWPSFIDSPANWGDVCVPQGPHGATPKLPRGRGLGGGSSINAMVFTRGHHTAYERWVAAGASNWDYHDLLPYFMRSEHALGKEPLIRGRVGPLTVAPAAPANQVLAAALEGAIEVGQRRATDISSGLEEGFGAVDLNIVDGHRQSAADAYLGPARGRQNLTIVTDALVHTLRIAHGRVTGLDYSVGRELVAASAAEVVVTAGAIGSPQLLMLSGIGPQRHLRDLGIEVVADLAGVGANLQDHPIANVVYRAVRPVPTPRNNHGEVVGLVRSRPGLSSPDLQLIFVDVPRPVEGYERPGHGFTIGVSTMLPRSRGTVRLANAKPGSPPLIDPNYYGDKRDVDTVTAGLRLARRIGASKALADWVDFEASPSSLEVSDADLSDYALRTVESYCHPVGTLAMGNAGVIDAELRVHGIENLRVADSSVMPSITSGNPNATVYAIAERAADLVLGIGVAGRGVVL